ncbi:MAG: LysR family transcriptional regulator [Burkholderiales bacterium]|nr:LysR family transcriptional regulator [Burkholderiales bacterium]
MLRLSFDAIRTIDAIARSGSFSAAAERLHKVPSTISYSVGKLEEQMGLRFFERNGPKVTLTPIGRELLEEGRCLLTAATDLESKLQKMAQGVEIELTVTMDELFPLEAFVEDILAFQQTPHQTRLHFRHEVLTGVWEALMQRRADLVIAAGEGPSGGGYKTYAVGTLAFAFCVSPDHPLAHERQPLQKNQLLEHTAIVIADSARYLPLRTIGLYSGQKQMTVCNLADKISLQKAGVGHGFLPRPCIAEELENDELIEMRVSEPKSDETFYLAWRTGEEGVALDWWRQRLMRAWLPHTLRTVRRQREDRIK